MGVASEPRPLDTGVSMPRQRRRKGERRPHPGRVDRRRCGRYAFGEAVTLRREIRRFRRDIHTGYTRAERSGAWLTTTPRRGGSNPREAEPRRERAGPGRPARRAYRKRFEPGAGSASAGGVLACSSASRRSHQLERHALHSSGRGFLPPGANESTGRTNLNERSHGRLAYIGKRGSSTSRRPRFATTAD